MRRFLTVAVAALVVAGCGGGGNDEQSASGGASTGIVAVASVDGTKVLVDSTGRTLYSAAVEHGGQIHCVDKCTSFWKPLLATAKQAQSASAAVGQQLGVITRPDGGRQLALDGRPLYTFTEEDAGGMNGDGFVDAFKGTRFEWQAARTGGGGAAPKESSGGDIY
jgi:predicted lipoprotein with Yx(FWY)xxD motif